MRMTAMIFAAAAILIAADAQAANPVVVMETSYGTIKIEMFEDQTPVTAKNFLDYVDSKHFDGLIFHRVVRKRDDGRGIAVIQGGGYTSEMKERETKKPIKLEAKLSNKRGTICMARTNDPDSATSQFFINVEDNLQLDPGDMREGYAVFGRVTEGMDVVEKIGKAPTESRLGHDDVPVKTIEIKSAKRAAAK